MLDAVVIAFKGAEGDFVLRKVIAWFKKFSVPQTLLFAYLGEMFGIAGIVGAYPRGLMLSTTNTAKI